MALGATTNWRNVVGGAETNGGGFDPALTAGMLTDLTATSATGTAPVCSSATYTFVSGDVGHYLYIAAGTNWTPGWYPIASVTAGAATLTAAVDSLRGGALLANNTPLTASGCATTASPTGGTFTIDYSSSTAPFLSLTDLASTASTTVTSAAAGFTRVMVGNILRLASATGSPVADSAGSRYLAITTYTDASNVVVDKQSGTYTAGIAKVGGAHADLINLCASSAGLGAQALSSPLLAGNVIKIKGAGSENPTAVDYNYSAGYFTFADGSSSGRISFIGYNGRPRLDHRGLISNSAAYGLLRNLYFVQTVGTYTAYGVFNDGSYNSYGCVYDQNGFDARQTAGSALNCIFKNSGSTAAGTEYAVTIKVSAFNQIISGNVFENIRGGAISSNAGMCSIGNNIIRNMKGSSAAGIIINTTSALYRNNIIGNTIDAGAGDAILITTANAITGSYITNNIISNHLTAGKYGIKCSVGTQVQNDSNIAGMWDYNNIYNCTAARNNHSAGLHDLALDPQYTNPIKSATFSVTIASPAVFSHTAHGHVANDILWFTTTGALPTGLTAGTPYFVISAGLTADAYEVSATLGGAAVNTSGTQSGTHTSTYVNGSADYSVGTNMKAVGFPSTFPA